MEDNKTSNNNTKTEKLDKLIDRLILAKYLVASGIFPPQDKNKKDQPK